MGVTAQSRCLLLIIIDNNDRVRGTGCGFKLLHQWNVLISQIKSLINDLIHDDYHLNGSFTLVQNHDLHRYEIFPSMILLN